MIKYYIAADDNYLDIVLSKLENEIHKLKESHTVTLRGDPALAINGNRLYIVQGVDLEPLKNER